MYSAKLLDHFQNPRCAGEVAGDAVSAQVQNPVCGDILALSARIEEDLIREIRFRAQGCVPCIACASAVCELTTGMGVENAFRITREKVLEHVGGVPAASNHAVELALDALHRLLRTGR